MSAPRPDNGQEGNGEAMSLDPVKHFQTSFQHLTDEFARLTSSNEALRQEQAILSTSITAVKTSLAAEITNLSTERDVLRSEMAEEKKVHEWWRKKEELLPRRNNSDETGRATRAAYMASENARILGEQLKSVEAEHEDAMEMERSIAAGLRDRIGRLEGRLRAQQAEADTAREKGEEIAKELREMEEKYVREKGKWGSEVQDLKAALREERRVREKKEEEVDRLTEALRDALEEARRFKSSAATQVPSRALAPLQLNIPRPQTPPRPTGTHSPMPKSPLSIPHTPKSLAKAYAYLDKRHTESQAQNRHLEASLSKAQTALREMQEQHNDDREKFIEWRKIEDERSNARKRKREERRRERGESGVPDGSSSGGKRRKSEEGGGDSGSILVPASGESAPLPLVKRGGNATEGGGKEEVAAKTSQTVQEDGGAMEVEPELEESQEYCSPEDMRSESRSITRDQAQPTMSIQHSQRPRSASQHSVRASKYDHRPSSPKDLQVAALAPSRPSQPSQVHRGRSQVPRAISPVIHHDTPTVTRPEDTPQHIKHLQRDRSSTRPTLASQATQAGQGRSTTKPSSTPRIPSNPTPRPSTSSSRLGQSLSTHPSRRSVSPNKAPGPALPGGTRTTAWLGGGSLVRTGSKSAIMTDTDPLHMSPPDTTGSVSRKTTAGPSRNNQSAISRSYSATGLNTPSTKPSLVRDRGDTSLRKAALTRFPSGDTSQLYGESPKPRTVSRSRLGESFVGTTDGVASGSGSTSQVPDLGLEGLSPAEKARRLKQLNKLSASEKREVYKGYKQEGGRYLPVDQVRRPATEGYEIDPSKNEGKSHQFHDVKRRKEDRKCMHGGDCEECRDWYEALGNIPKFNQAPAFGVDTNEDDEEVEGLRRHQNMVSRHRETWIKPPTPPGFWSIGFPTTQEVEAQNKRADAMEREKEERMMKDAAASNSKWRKKA